MSKRKPFASPEFIEVSLWNHGEVRYPTDSLGQLSIGNGEVKLRYRFDYDHGGDPKRIEEGIVNIACYHRVTDSTGAEWEARACFHPGVLVYRLLDLDSIYPPCWEHNDRERAKVIAKRPLLTSLEVVKDDRFYRRFWIDDTLLEIQFKYQGITIDIGSEDESSLVIRLSGFFGHWCHVPMKEDCYVPPWRGGKVRPPHADYDPKDGLMEFDEDETPGADYENLAPMLYSLSVYELLFRNDAGWEEGYPTQSSFPRPLVWSRVEEKSSAAKGRKKKPAKRSKKAKREPQPNVVFHSA